MAAFLGIGSSGGVAVKRSQAVVLLCGLTMMLGITGIVLTLTNPAGFGASFTPHPLVSLGFSSVGALIILRRPHRVGTLFLSFGVLTGVTGFLFQVCSGPSDSNGGGLPAICGHNGRLGMLLWPAGYLFLGALFLFFPTDQWLRSPEEQL